MTKNYKLINKVSTSFSLGYSKQNCLISGFNPDLPAVIASPFIEQALKNGQKVGMSLYVYQDAVDKDGKSWEHQPIKVKVLGLQHGFSLGDEVIFDDLMCVRIVTHAKNSTTSNCYYKANGVQLLEGDDINV